MAKTSKLRLGLLGTGIAAEKLYLPAFQKLGHRIELVACANRRRSKAEAYAKKAGIPRVVDDAEALFALPDVEAVLLSLPITELPAHVLAALRAGKAVLSEKPVGPTAAAARRLIRAAKRFDAPWLVGENFAFMSHTERLAKLVRAGKLGEIRLVQATQLTFVDSKNAYFNTAWRAKPAHAGGFLTDGGVHLANVVRRCFGMPKVVKSLTASFDPKLPPLDTAVAALRFESGALGSWSSCFSAHYEGPLLRVYGALGTAELSWNELVVKTAKGKETRHAAEADSFYSELEHFADMVKKGVPPRVTPEDALADLELIEAVIKG
jgi:predicted dehydrogenase